MERSYEFPSNYFKNKYLLIGHLWELYYKGLDANTLPVLRTLFLTKSEAKTPEFDANTEPVLRTLLLTKSEAKTPEFDAN